MNFKLHSSNTPKPSEQQEFIEKEINDAILLATIPIIVGFLIGSLAHISYLGFQFWWVIAVNGAIGLLTMSSASLLLKGMKLRTGQLIVLAGYLATSTWLPMATGGIESPLLPFLTIPLAYSLFLRDTRIMVTTGVLVTCIISIMAGLNASEMLATSYFENTEFQSKARVIVVIEMLIIITLIVHLLIGQHKRAETLVTEMNESRLIAVDTAQTETKARRELGEMLRLVLAKSDVAVAYTTSTGQREIVGSEIMTNSPLTKLLETGSFDINELTQMLETQDLLVRKPAGFGANRSVIEVEYCHSTWTIESLVLSNESRALICNNVTIAREAERIQLQHARLESLGALTAGVAHDFNNHLMVISAAFETLSLDKKNSQPTINTGLQVVDRAATLVRQLMDFSRPQNDADKITEQAAILIRFREMLPDMLGSAYTTSVSAALTPPVTGNASSFESALLNLIINAREAMPDGGHISIHSRYSESHEISTAGLPQGRYGIIEVQDNGPGIPENVVDRIFEPFFSTKSRAGGNRGLGLAMVFGFARRAGGTAMCRSFPDGTTVFTLILPIAAVSETNNNKNSEPLSSTVTTDILDKRVLFVDDEEVIVQLVSNLLRKEGLAVTTATSYHEAEQLLSCPSTAPFDLVISDLHLEDGRTARDVITALKAHSKNAKSIIISGNPDLQPINHASMAHITVLQKPLEITTMLSLIRSELQS